jgi:hypothetical protein
MRSAHPISLAVHLGYCGLFLVPGFSMLLGHPGARSRCMTATYRSTSIPILCALRLTHVKARREIGTHGPSNDVDRSIGITLWLIACIAMEARDFSPPLHVGILHLQLADLSSHL